MPKGQYSQSAVVLLKTMPSPAELAAALGEFRLLRPLEGEPAGSSADWMGGRHGVLLGLKEEVNGTAPVQAFDRPWPDGMGDPKQDPLLFGAWTLGFMGPFTYPGSLERALQQCWGWEGAPEAVAEHQAFVRINATYVGGADPEAPCLPEGYDPFEELVQLTRMAQALGRLPGALAYFNPSGEVLLPFERVAESMDYHLPKGLPALDLWSNLRLVGLEELGPWGMMDCVGMGQLEVLDQEACFPAERIDPEEVAPFLRNVTDYLRVKGPVIKHGDSIDGPGGIRWRGFHAEALLTPPRRVLRWFPEGSDIPEPLAAGIGMEGPKESPATE